MKSQKPLLKRLGVQIEPRLFHDLKIVLAKKGLTVRGWVEQHAKDDTDKLKP